MQRYESYKSSGVKWLGDIPENWDVCRNIGLFDERKEINQPDMELLSVTINRGVIKQEEITEKKDSSNEDKSKYKVVRKDDLAYNKMRMWQGAIGRSEYEGIVSPAYVILSPRDRLYSRYYHYLYRTEAFIAEANRNSYGLCLDMNSLRYEDFKTIYSPVPPRTEVERIVAFLDQKTAEIDAAIVKKERLIELLHEQSANLVYHAVTRGLDSSKEARFSGHNLIGDIPPDWNVRRLKFLSKKIGSGVTPPGGAQNYLDDGVMFIRSQNVYFDGLRTDDIAYIPEKTHKAMSGTQVKNNDVLLNITGASIGRACVYRMDAEANVNQHVCIIRPVGNLDPDFLCCVLNSKVGSQQIWLSQNGSSREGLNFFDLKSFYIPLPSFQEQVAIGAFCRSSVDTTRAAVNSIANEILVLRQLLQETVAAAVTGKIRV